MDGVKLVLVAHTSPVSDMIGTYTSINSGGFKLVLGAHTSDLSDMMQSFKCFNDVAFDCAIFNKFKPKTIAEQVPAPQNLNIYLSQRIFSNKEILKFDWLRTQI